MPLPDLTLLSHIVLGAGVFALLVALFTHRYYMWVEEKGTLVTGTITGITPYTKRAACLDVAYQASDRTPYQKSFVVDAHQVHGLTHNMAIQIYVASDNPRKVALECLWHRSKTTVHRITVFGVMLLVVAAWLYVSENGFPDWFFNI